MKILVLNGPNLNLLDQRDKEIYGGVGLDAIATDLRGEYQDLMFEFRQSNVEGDLINWIQKAMEEGFSGLIANFGGYSHTSVAIRDALELCSIPKVEVHLSNLHTRETFRHESITAAKMNGMIAGFGPYVYSLGVQALLRLV
jgi:3-dehydroquinate dehydratase-2